MNNVKDVEKLVGYGVSVNEIDQKNEDKFTPLHWAAHSGSLEVRVFSLVSRFEFDFNIFDFSACIGFFGNRRVWMLKHRKVGRRFILHRYAVMTHVFK